MRVQRQWRDTGRGYTCGMVVYRGEVSHRLARRQLRAQWRQGAITRDTVCDADFLLVTAANFHGQQVGRLCPICESPKLREVLWVFGDELGRMSGTARNEDEIVAFVQRGLTFTVHTVEVCPKCRWNHILMAREAVGESA
mgnify:FL=1